MSSDVSFGAILSANRQRNCEFNNEQKAAMCSEIFAGESYQVVAEHWNTTKSTVHRIFKHWKSTQSFNNKPRSGRPLKLTQSEVRYICLLIKRNRKIGYAALIGAIDGKVSKKTIRRAIQQFYKRKWKSMQRIPLSKETAAQRLRFTQG